MMDVTIGSETQLSDDETPIQSKQLLLSVITNPGVEIDISSRQNIIADNLIGETN